MRILFFLLFFVFGNSVYAQEFSCISEHKIEGYHIMVVTNFQKEKVYVKQVSPQGLPVSGIKDTYSLISLEEQGGKISITGYIKSSQKVFLFQEDYGISVSLNQQDMKGLVSFGYHGPFSLSMTWEPPANIICHWL